MRSEPESPKRSKTGLTKTLLHREKPKHGSATDGDASSYAGSEASSRPETPPLEGSGPGRHFGSLKKSNAKGSSTMAPGEAAAGSSTAGDHETAAATAQHAKPSIEQSVRLFKTFEILRSGDTAAIQKAILESSTGSAPGEAHGLEDTTLLHVALQCADPPVVEQIISVGQSNPAVGINTNAQDREGNTPLHLAAMLGRPTSVQLLLEQPGINESITNYQGKTALDLAKTPEIYQKLQLARSLYLESVVQKVQVIVKQRQYEQLEALLEDSRVAACLDVNGSELTTEPVTSQSGGTLLHEAARSKDVRLIQVLLMNGADPFRRDRKGKLPQDVTKDDRTRNILKKSPAAAAAQRGIQEKTILGSGSAPSNDGTPGGKDAREMKGFLKKWTNYTSGYKLRWFVLEDGVMSYYKHQDDAGSACRGAINMRIARLYMDAQDKTRFEIQGKSSVKYHLKANHVVEAKRWFWALNNAIQWAKDEAKQQEGRRPSKPDLLNTKGLAPAQSLGSPLTTNASRHSFQDSTHSMSHAPGDDDVSIQGSVSQSVAGTNEQARRNSQRIPGDHDDEDEYGDDASSHEVKPVSKDAFTITAHSASLQLGLLSQVSAALQAESRKDDAPSVSDPTIVQALSTYESAVASLQTLINDLLKISRDRDAYWQYRLDREADMRRLWEDSMAKVAQEQEELQGRIEESEEKRKRTKRALKDALESQQTLSKQASPVKEQASSAHDELRVADLSESDVDDNDEFFDAVDAGEIEVVDVKADAVLAPQTTHTAAFPSAESESRETRRRAIESSFRGYEDPVRTRLKLDADNRPKIGLWGILKSMIGKDMTKMTLPVSFNEPTSLLQRVTEDMEYADLLDFAADRPDSTERLVYVAAFAASEYASTVGRIAKPFNPLLGETYEYVRPDKGYRFFVEQVSHHPPIGAAYAESAKWEYYGESAIKSKFYGKSFDINLLGTWFLKLRPPPTPENPNPDEELYTWKKVTSSVVGIITGNPTVDNYGPMEIRNHKTGEVCMLEFKQRSWKASSAYQVSGKIMDAAGKTRWSIGGRWNDKIYARKTPGFEDSGLGLLADGNNAAYRRGNEGSDQAFLVWQANPRPAKMPFNLTSFVVTFMSLPDRLKPILPPTDTRLRPDQRAMEDGEYDFAATEKNRVEEKQRAKRREREANGDDYVPRWFRKAKCEMTDEEYWLFDGEYWKVRDAVSSGTGTWERVEDIF